MGKNNRRRRKKKLEVKKNFSEEEEQRPQNEQSHSTTSTSIKQNLDIEDPEDQVDSDTEEEVENVDKNNKQVDEITGNQMSRRKFCYPQRPGVQDCSYYLRTGRCRFGMSCKFNHPVPREIQSLNQSINSNTVSIEMNPNNSANSNRMSTGMNLKDSMNSNKLYVGMITGEQLFTVINFVIEVPTLVLEQLLSSEHQILYAILATSFSVMTMVFSTSEFIYRGRKARVVWRWRKIPWFYYPSPSPSKSKLFGSAIDFIGLLGAIFQFTFTVIAFSFYIKTKYNPIKISMWPPVFAFCVMWSQFLDNSPEVMLPRYRSIGEINP
ncbi:hypothetical protein AB3S75_015839 [Citrus x aurantiifolia]